MRLCRLEASWNKDEAHKYNFLKLAEENGKNVPVKDYSKRLTLLASFLNVVEHIVYWVSLTYLRQILLILPVFSFAEFVSGSANIARILRWNLQSKTKSRVRPRIFQSYG